MISDRLSHPINGFLAMLLVDAGMCIALRLSQLLKAEISILLKVSGRLIEASEVHWKKAYSPIVVTDVGTVKDFKLEQLSKVWLSIMVIPSGNVIEVSDVQ